MIIYNVTVKVGLEIASEWLQWMESEHIPALMNTGCFTASKLFRLLEQDDREGPTYVVQYMAPDMKAYQLYIDQYAQQMRNETEQKWGNKYHAFRTLLDQKFEMLA